LKYDIDMPVKAGPPLLSPTTSL